MPLRKVLVREYMAANPVTVAPDTPILQAIHALVEHRISGLPVVDLRGNLVGMLSESDCLPIAVQAIVELAERFMRNKLRRYPVVERQRVVGQISRRDVLRAMEFLY